MASTKPPVDAGRAGRELDRACHCLNVHTVADTVVHEIAAEGAT
jgi:hypothetical protein